MKTGIIVVKGEINLLFKPKDSTMSTPVSSTTKSNVRPIIVASDPSFLEHALRSRSEEEIAQLDAMIRPMLKKVYLERQGRIADAICDYYLACFGIGFAISMGSVADGAKATVGALKAYGKFYLAVLNPF
jgi:hypothetical protein